MHKSLLEDLIKLYRVTNTKNREAFLVDSPFSPMGKERGILTFFLWILPVFKGPSFKPYFVIPPKGVNAWAKCYPWIPPELR
jgi:hypothetical protein